MLKLNFFLMRAFPYLNRSSLLENSMGLLFIDFLVASLTTQTPSGAQYSSVINLSARTLDCLLIFSAAHQLEDELRPICAQS